MPPRSRRGAIYGEDAELRLDEFAKKKQQRKGGGKIGGQGTQPLKHGQAIWGEGGKGPGRFKKKNRA